jgi:hypothetical protein
LKNRSEKVTGRGQILTILKSNSRSIARKSGEICTIQTLLQPISFKSDRLLVVERNGSTATSGTPFKKIFIADIKNVPAAARSKRPN